MKQGSIKIVPAGKRPKAKIDIGLKERYTYLQGLIKAKKIISYYFLTCALLVIITLLSLHTYLSNYVYVVYFNDLEVGIVENARDLETFVYELSERCGDLYGMASKPGDNISLVRAFRPDSVPEPEKVQSIIRQNLTLVTDAYMITVDDKPLVPVNSESDLDLVIELLRDRYSSNSRGVKLLEFFIAEDLNVEEYIVNPETVRTAEEVFALLVENSEATSLSPAALAVQDEIGEKSESENRQISSSENAFLPVDEDDALTASEVESISIPVNVITIEEVTIIENVPFEIEYLYDDEMWIIEKELIVPGVNGEKKLTYHITRENGIELSRKLVDEQMLLLPVKQIELHGTARVPTPEMIIGLESESQQPELQTKAPAPQHSISIPIITDRRIATGEVIRAPLMDQRPSERSSIQKSYNSNLSGAGSQVGSTGSFIWPVKGGGQVTPGRGFSTWHTGIDIGAPHGTEIVAADNGVVWFSGWGSTQGNYIIIYHGKFWTLYLHNSVNLVSTGDIVRKGEVIARVGATGRSSGPHLHFEVRLDDGSGEWHTYYQHLPIDPMQFFQL